MVGSSEKWQNYLSGQSFVQADSLLLLLPNIVSKQHMVLHICFCDTLPHAGRVLWDTDLQSSSTSIYIVYVLQALFHTPN